MVCSQGHTEVDLEILTMCIGMTYLLRGGHPLPGSFTGAVAF